MCDLLARSGTWERTVIRAELAAEVGVAITEGEYQLLLAESAFGLRSVPHYPPRVSRAIVNAQNKLALRKGCVRAEGGEPAQEPVVAARRADISAPRKHGWPERRSRFACLRPAFTVGIAGPAPANLP